MELRTNEKEIHEARLQDVEQLFGPTQLQSDFAVLTRWEGNLLGVRKLKGGRHLLECIEAGKAYEARDKPDLQCVRRDFVAYFDGLLDWRLNHRWKEIRQPWKRRLVTALAIVSAMLLVANLTMWVRSHWIHDIIVLSRDAVHGDYEIRSADGAIMVGRDIPWPLGGTVFRYDSRYWYATGLGFFGVLPFWWALGWAIAYENKGRRATACRYCGVCLPASAVSCPGCGKPYAPIQCPQCGYDLRASGERCPECGAAPGLKPPPASGA